MPDYKFGISEHFDGEAVAAAALGGLLLGVSVMFKTSVTGQVLGVSGSTRKLINAPNTASFAFILGLVLAGIIMSRTYGGFEPIPPVNRSNEQLVRVYLRFVLGGICVGFGTALGNGCTSGHGLTGLARLSIRSWFAVPNFMFWAALVGTLSGSLSEMPTNAATELSAPGWQTAMAVSFVSIAVLLLILGAAILAKPLTRFADKPDILDHLKAVAEFFSGSSFGLGLAISTMARPSKVAGFLDIASGAWDPSLAFVMGGALCVTFPFFQILERKFTTPVLGGTFGLPPRMNLPDVELVAGTTLFGIGWGTCGMCPGPGWVAVGAWDGEGAIAMMLGMVCGTGLWVVQKRIRDRNANMVKPANDAKVAPEPSAYSEEPHTPRKNLEECKVVDIEADAEKQPGQAS